MKIIETRSKKTPAGPGLWGYDAEAVVEDQGQVLYIHANYYMGDHYTVSSESMFDYMTGETEEEPYAEFIEEYEDLEDAESSEYYEVFEMLEEMIKDLN
ncbi:MAG: hypothetical protein Q4G58_10085 [bacterium]|nr:hypothetical protein [bacterium]